jgi:hypothetical protein
VASGRAAKVFFPRQFREGILLENSIAMGGWLISHIFQTIQSTNFLNFQLVQQTS